MPQFLQNVAFGGMGYAQFSQNPPPGDGAAALPMGHGEGGAATGRGGGEHKDTRTQGDRLTVIMPFSLSRS